MSLHSAFLPSRMNIFCAENYNLKISSLKFITCLTGGVLQSRERNPPSVDFYILEFDFIVDTIPSDFMEVVHLTLFSLKLMYPLFLLKSPR